VGGSSGSTSTVGFKEAKDVAIVVNHAQQLQLTHPIILYGISMGTSAILRAIAKENVKPDGIILELPYTKLITAAKNRLKFLKIPPFPTAELIIFWGSIQHGFNGFAHNPITYAKQVKCPSLILQGKLDKWIDMTEIASLFQNLPEPKQLVIFPYSGHQILVTVDQEYWLNSVNNFLSKEL
jgi:alpha-beta hydrolase superfamily lysophospholipase